MVEKFEAAGVDASTFRVSVIIRLRAGVEHETKGAPSAASWGFAAQELDMSDRRLDNYLDRSFCRLGRNAAINMASSLGVIAEGRKRLGSVALSGFEFASYSPLIARGLIT